MIQTFTLQPADLLRMRSGPPMEIQYGDTKLVFLDPKRLRAGESFEFSVGDTFLTVNYVGASNGKKYEGEEKTAKQELCGTCGYLTKLGAANPKRSLRAHEVKQHGRRAKKLAALSCGLTDKLGDPCKYVTGDVVNPRHALSVHKWKYHKIAGTHPRRKKQ